MFFGRLLTLLTIGITRRSVSIVVIDWRRDISRLSPPQAAGLVTERSVTTRRDFRPAVASICSSQAYWDVTSQTTTRRPAWDSSCPRCLARSLVSGRESWTKTPRLRTRCDASARPGHRGVGRTSPGLCASTSVLSRPVDQERGDGRQCGGPGHRLGPGDSPQ